MAPILPDGCFTEYLAEGAANIVYRFSVPPATPRQSLLDEFGEGTPPPTYVEPPIWETIFENKLLRVRKDLPTTVPCQVSHMNWISHIDPIFSDDQIVSQCLVELKPSKIIERLNEELKGWEREPGVKGSLRPHTDHRPLKRNGIYLADDEHGLLITDMTPRGLEEETVEFKPKWLVQSPNAPKRSIRCRQCARVARLNAQSQREGRPLLKSFCPLDLLSKDPQISLFVTRQLLAPQCDESKMRRFSKWLRTNTLLPRLRNMQEVLDLKGVLEADMEDKDFLTAMTLRDCTVFMRFSSEKEDATIEARIGDLDLKSSKKEHYWKNIERQLIEEGWYEGIEDTEDEQPLTCALYPERWNPPKAVRRNSA